MKNLKFDYNFSVDAHVKSGISSVDISKYLERVKTGLGRLEEMVSNDQVGFPNLCTSDISSIKDFAKESKGKFNDLIVVGIGGSALGIEMLTNALLPVGNNSKSLADRGFFPRCWIADNIDPSKIFGIVKKCKAEDTLVVIISKSGNTVETAANYSYIHDWLLSSGVEISKHVVVVTDPEKGPLREYVTANNLRSFPIMSSIGGRFSVLSPVGLLPAALLGIDIDKLLLGAKELTSKGYDQLLLASAIYLYFMENGKSINVMMAYSSKLEKFSEWFCQLWGESLGKKLTYDNKEITFGTTPVRATGAIDQHSQIQLFREGTLDKHVSFIGVASHEFDKEVTGNYYPAFNYLKGIKLGDLLNAELKATEGALLTSNVPSIRVDIDQVDEYTLGQLINFYQFIVPIIGLTVNIDPFNQPGVEEAKDYAYGLMNREGYEGKKIELEKIYIKDEKFTI